MFLLKATGTFIADSKVMKNLFNILFFSHSQSSKDRVNLKIITGYTCQEVLPSDSKLIAIEIDEIELI